MKKQIDDILLSETSFDKIVKKKMEEEILKEAQLSNKKKIKIITDIKLVPKEKIFSKAAIYRVFNRINKTQSFINGVQAEALLDKSIYGKMQNAEIDAFSTDNEYIKFEKAKLLM